MSKVVIQIDGIVAICKRRFKEFILTAGICECTFICISKIKIRVHMYIYNRDKSDFCMFKYAKDKTGGHKQLTHIQRQSQPEHEYDAD